MRHESQHNQLEVWRRQLRALALWGGGFLCGSLLGLMLMFTQTTVPVVSMLFIVECLARYVAIEGEPFATWAKIAAIMTGILPIVVLLLATVFVPTFARSNRDERDR
jgi:hypothetical protein